jgi:hypothetical protein
MIGRFKRAQGTYQGYQGDEPLGGDAQNTFVGECQAIEGAIKEAQPSHARSR